MLEEILSHVIRLVEFSLFNNALVSFNILTRIIMAKVNNNVTLELITA